MPRPRTLAAARADWPVIGLYGASLVGALAFWIGLLAWLPAR